MSFNSQIITAALVAITSAIKVYSYATTHDWLYTAHDPECDGEQEECDGFFTIKSFVCGPILTRPFSTSGYSQEEGKEVHWWTQCTSDDGPDCENEETAIAPLSWPSDEVDCSLYGYDLAPEPFESRAAAYIKGVVE